MYTLIFYTENNALNLLIYEDILVGSLVTKALLQYNDHLAMHRRISDTNGGPNDDVVGIM